MMQTMTPTVANVLAVFDAATPDQREAGMTWYARAYEAAVALDPTNPERAVGVIAAVSPQKEWTQNLALAARAYPQMHLSDGTLGANVAKANRILAGEAPLDVLGGEKVRAFFEGIVSQGATDTVCIDRHSFDIAVGVRNENKGRGQVQRVKSGNGGYAECAEVTLEAARQRGVSGAQMQAVTWEVWRDRYKYMRGGKARSVAS